MHFEWIFIKEQGQIIYDIQEQYQKKGILRIKVLYLY